MLQGVIAAVAPGSLWPVDVLLRVLFSNVDQASAAIYFISAVILLTACI